MPADSPRLSRSVEDYLKAIYALSEEGDAASTSRIAEAMDVQPSSVSGMVKRLAEGGLVEHAPYRGVRLTEEGATAALRIIRRHRILETYLSDRLGYSWDDVHEEAERLEHAASEELIDRMAEALENPQRDPHGAPIPTRAGTIEAIGRTTLGEARPGTAVQILAVRDDDGDRLRYLESRGLMPGVLLVVEGRAPFNGPVSVRVGGNEGPTLAVGHELAGKIRVSGPVDPDDGAGE